MNKIYKKEPNIIELIKHPFITSYLNNKSNFADFLSDLFDYMSIVQ